MLTQALTAEDPKLGGSVRAATRPLPHPALLALTSGVLLWLSFPPVEWSGSAWFAMAPLFLLIPSRRSKGSIYLGTWVGGLAFWILAIQWIWWTDESALLGWITMATFLSLWWPIFLFLARFSHRRLNLPIMVVAPILWIALEYIRAYVLTGFPWYYLAHSQYRFTHITQIADFSGALGLSFLIAMVNAYWVELLTLPLFRRMPGGSWWARLARPQRVRFAVVVIGILGTLSYGAYRIGSANFRTGPRIALIQSSEIQAYNQDKKKSPHELRAMYESLVERAARTEPRPDLIVWPETAYPYGYVVIDPRIDPKLLNDQVKIIHPDFIGEDWRQRRDQIVSYFDTWMASLRIPMMVGATTHDFRPSGYSRYNSAILFQAGSAIQSYHKLHLVPFGEYVPLIDVLPWLTYLTPYRGTRPHFLDFGSSLSWFELGPYRIAAAICFEDTVPQVVRRFFSEAPGGRKPDLLVNLSNDGWFHETSEHEMHLAVSTFRCIENRVPLARAVNTGISAMIDGNGRIVQSLPKNKADVLIASAPLDDRIAPYVRWGDWLGQFCLASTIGLLILGTFAPRTKRAAPSMA